MKILLLTAIVMAEYAYTRRNWKGYRNNGRTDKIIVLLCIGVASSSNRFDVFCVNPDLFRLKLTSGNN